MAVSIENNSKPIPIQSKNILQSDKYIPKEYRNVAEGMESQFADYMINEMKKTAGRSEDNPESQAEEIYGGFLDNERAKAMATQGLGIKKVILDQIYPQEMRNRLAYEQHLLREKNKREMINPNSIVKNNSDQEIKMHDPNGQGGLR